MCANIYEMVYRAVLFDLDGTLLDTLEDIADAVNRVLAEFGFPQHQVASFRYFVGDGMEVLAARSLPENRRDETTIADVTALINKEYSRRWMAHTRPYTGIPELLDAITGLGVRMSILTNKPQSSAELTVSSLLPGWCFDFVVGAKPSLPKKPDPTGALQIATQSNLNPDEFLYLGDSAVDMATATAAKMYPVGALWGFRTADELIKSGAKALIKSPPQLIQFLVVQTEAH